MMTWADKFPLDAMEKTCYCYCHTCNRYFHWLGINSHRAAHRRRGETCTITYTHGNTVTFDWRPNPASTVPGVTTQRIG